MAGTVWTGGCKGPLQGLRVVDFGQYLAGPLLGMLLADQGADVVRVDPPDGPSWDTPVNATLLRGRRNIRLDLKTERDRARARALIASADVLIENFRPGVMARLGIGAEACLRLAPRLVYCSLPGFGASDPRAGLAAWEGVVMAAAGGYALRAPGAAEPTVAFSPLALASVFAALEGAVAVVAALIARERDGVGQHVETPLYDSLFEGSGAASMTMERRTGFFIDFPLGWYRCADGRYLNMGSAWLRHFEAMARAAGKASWIDDGLFDYETLKSDPAAGQALRAKFVELFATEPAREWEELGQSQGSAVAMARTMAEWMDEPHALASGTLVDIDDPVLGRARVPGLAVQASSSSGRPAPPRDLPGSDDETILPILDALAAKGVQAGPTVAAPSSAPPLAGLRVLDFTRVLAGPMGGRILAQLGADVVKIDSTRSDRRALTPLPISHEYANRGKRSIDLDLSDPRAAPVLAGLLSGADLILQNFTLGVAERLGIDEASARERNPGVVYTYLNAFGGRGPWAGARGYAELANTACGITARTNGDLEVESGRNSLSFDLPRWPFTDYAAGVLTAFAAVLGVYERATTGVAPSLETSLIRTTGLEQINYLIAYEGRAVREHGGSRGWSPRQSLYDTQDGAVFIGARASQVTVLVRALKARNAGELADAVRRFSTAQVEKLLQGLGIGVHAVTVVDQLLAPGGPADGRGLRIEDETADFGRVAMVGPVARFSRTPLVPGAFPRPFGAETEELRAEALS